MDEDTPTNNPAPTWAKIGGRNWGGRRPGAGAPKGNMNGLKDGKYSERHRALVAIFASMPEVRDGLLAIAQRRRRQKRLAEAGASELLAGLLQRTGEIVLNPESNHVEANQDLLDFLRSAEATFRAISKKQSREAAKIKGAIKRGNLER